MNSAVEWRDIVDWPDINTPVVSSYSEISGPGYSSKVHNTFAILESFQSGFVIGQIHFDEREGPFMRQVAIWGIDVDSHNSKVLSQCSLHHALSYVAATACDSNSHHCSMETSQELSWNVLFDSFFSI